MNKLYKYLRTLESDVRAKLLSCSYKNADEHRADAIATEIVLMEHRQAFELSRQEVLKNELSKVESVCRLVQEKPQLLPEPAVDSVLFAWHRARVIDPSITRRTKIVKKKIKNFEKKNQNF